MGMSKQSALLESMYALPRARSAINVSAVFLTDTTVVQRACYHVCVSHAGLGG